uniref:Gypsy retrotransposon integrase-like protein 1 n=1 Tax=Leptobrachium leishanense TaxID=445787 RepID=A0A8C5MGF4_9ANUR
MAALVGTVSPFDCELQSWDEYIEVLDYFFQANEITDAGKRKAVLLSGVGASTYSLLRSLLCPMTPAEKTYQELVVVLKAHYNPKPSEIVQRYKFNSRTRHTGEKVADYVAELKKLAQYCEYGPTLPQMLRDRLVCGVNDDRMQRRLLSEVDLTFEKALTMCLAMESADRNIKDLQGFSGDEESQSQRSHQGQSVVHNVGAVDKRGWKTDYECFRCKGNHAPHECKFINELCHHCQKRGHIKRACKSKHVMQSHKTPFQGLRGERKGKEKAGRSHLVKEEDVSETEDAGDINTIYSVSHKMPKVAPILQKLKVNGMNIEFEVDTGCGITIISKKQYSKLWKNTDIPEWEPCNLTLKTYTGEKMLVLGQVIGTVQSQMDNKKLTMVVVEGAGPNLLGRNWLKDLRVLPQLVNTVTASPTLHLADLLDRYAEVFKDELGQLKGTTAKIHVNSEAQPRFYKPRRIPFAVKPLVETPAEEERVLLLEENGVPLVKADQVRKWTDKDTVLARVREFVLRGWPKRVEKSVFGAYVKRKEELSVEAGCVLWGARVVIPPPGRTDLLKHLHTTHPGIIRMKGLARSYMWWPKMDADIEAMVKTCTMCQENRNSPQCAPLHPWEVPNLPWRRLHIDYAGPWMGKMFLILVDAYSKWIEAYPLSKSTSAVTIQCLRQSFSQHGIPEMVVSDNGTSFTSMEFQEFMARNGIKHVTTAPYHAASNGLAERAVQTFKGLIKKSSGDSIEVKMARALFSYRITPQSTTGKSPAELLCGRKLRSTLDLIHPDFKGQVQEKQVKQKLYHDQHAKERHLREGDKVYTRNFGVGPSWIPGTVQTQTGPVSCTVALGNGQLVRRHIDQVRNRHVAYPEDLQSLAEPLTQDMEILAPLSGVVLAEAGDEGQMEGEFVTEISSETAHVEGEQELRRSTRTKKAPTYLQDYT